LIKIRIIGVSIGKQYTMKVLVDEMYDGIDTKLKEFGYEAYSVKKLITEGKKLTSDYSIIRYAEQNGMVMVTEDIEVGKACKENNIPCVLLDSETIFKIILEELGNFKNR
jgi:rRNA-processing protein FCF1